MPPKSPAAARPDQVSRRVSQVRLTGSHRIDNTTCTAIAVGIPEERHHTSNTFIARTLVRLGNELVVNGQWYLPLTSGAIFAYAYA